MGRDIMTFPAELITLLASTLLGGMLKVWGMKNETQRMQAGIMLQAVVKEQEGFKAAREYSNKGFQFTRRIIAIAAIMAIIVWPKVAAIFWPDIPITVGWTELQGGFLFFTDEKLIMKWHEIKGGLVLTPMDTHLVSAISGLYFGSSTVGNRG